MSSFDSLITDVVMNYSKYHVTRGAPTYRTRKNNDYILPICTFK